MTTMPHGERAVVPDAKLRDYLLNERHASQPGHAILFRRLLGLTVENAGVLREALRRAAAESPVDREARTA